MLNESSTKMNSFEFYKSDRNSSRYEHFVYGDFYPPPKSARAQDVFVLNLTGESVRPFVRFSTRVQTIDGVKAMGTNKLIMYFNFD